jgi:inosine/xanthosine triphosphatase
MLVLVGSKNPVKIESVKDAFEKYFQNVDVRGIEVRSGVPDQPVNEDTFNGAKNRAESLLVMNKANGQGAQYFVGIEGGIINIFGKWFSLGCICIINDKGQTSYGTSPHFTLPGSVIGKLLQGTELGTVIDEISNQHNSKQKSGAIGHLTKDVITRKDLYTQGIITALIPFINPDLYKP